MLQQSTNLPYVVESVSQDDDEMKDDTSNLSVCQLHNFCIKHRKWANTPCSFQCSESEDFISCEVKLFFKCGLGRVDGRYDTFRVFDKLHSFLISMFSSL